MFELIKAILGNFLFFFLHLKSINSFPKPLPAEKEKELLSKVKKYNDTKARNELIEHNLRLVSHIIKKYYSDLKKEILQYAVTWMNLEDIMLSEISQREKDKYSKISIYM